MSAGDYDDLRAWLDAEIAAIDATAVPGGDRRVRARALREVRDRLSSPGSGVTANTVRGWRHEWAALPLVEKDRYQPGGTGGEDAWIAAKVNELLAHRATRPLTDEPEDS